MVGPPRGGRGWVKNMYANFFAKDFEFSNLNLAKKSIYFRPFPSYKKIVKLLSSKGGGSTNKKKLCVSPMWVAQLFGFGAKGL